MRPPTPNVFECCIGFLGTNTVRIRFKWFTIKGFQKFTGGRISAFITWFLMSQTLRMLIVVFHIC